MYFVERTLTFFLLFICLISNAQDLLKIRPISSGGNDYNYAMARDSEANLYLSYTLFTSTSHDSVNINNEYFFNDYTGGSYLIKLDVNRNIVWMIETSYAITNIEIASTGNVIVSGYGNYSFYVSALSPSGATIWEVSEGTSGGMVPYDMVLDKYDNIYITGNVKSWSVFGLTLHNKGCCLEHDFLIKFNSSGGFEWIKASNPDNQTVGRSLDIDNDGNILLVGRYYFAMTLGGFSLGNNIGYRNSYLACITPAGNVRWVKGYGGDNGHLDISKIHVDEGGNIYFGGSFYGTIKLGDTTITSYGGNDIIYGTFTSNGIVNWLKHLGTSGSENFNDLVLYNNSFLLTGHTSSQLKIGSNIIGTIDNEGKSFILKSTTPDTILWSKELSFSNVDKFLYGYPLNNRNLILPLSDTTTLIYGCYVNNIVGLNQFYLARSQDLYTAILSEGCKDVELIPNPDINISLCPGETTEVYLSVPDIANSSSIDLLEGDVNFEIKDKTLHILSLNSDQAIFRLYMENCKSETSQNISLIKKQEPTPPEIKGNLNLCETNLENELLSVYGENIKWYNLESLDTPKAIGNTYQLTRSEILFVTQTIDGCESQPSEADVFVDIEPEPPFINQNHYMTCLNSELIIDLSPNQYNWYDSDMNYLQSSDSMKIDTGSTGTYHYFITSNGRVCESAPTAIEVEVIEYDINDVFIPNVITSNGDGHNDYFYLKHFDSEYCLGEFEYIEIINRNGIPIYKNTKREFKWYPKENTSGIYYYLIKFQLADFKGSLSVLD